MREYSYCPICGTPLTKRFIEEKQRKHCPKCSFVYYENPLPVALAIDVRDRKFLMVKRGIELYIMNHTKRITRKVLEYH